MWSSSEKEELTSNLAMDEEGFPKRPIAVVNPVQSPRRKTEEAEVSVHQTCTHDLVSRTKRNWSWERGNLIPRVSFLILLSEFLFFKEERS